eukprot:SAG31_NODE_19935_length_588_cov_0.787321_1_plen_102_part_01
MDAAENPAHKTKAAMKPDDDIEMALQRGTLTGRDAIVELQRQLREETEARISATMQVDHQSAAGFRSAVQSTFAQLTEAPTNWYFSCSTCFQHCMAMDLASS